MNMLNAVLSEADTKAKLIDPKLHKRGWTEDLIHREETACGIDIIDGKPTRRDKGRIDYLLRIRVSINTRPLAVALLEVKKNTEPPDKGLEQAKRYARLNNVPFVYSTNGYLFVEYDSFSGKTSVPCPLEEFPTPEELRKRYEQGMKFSLESEEAKPLLVPLNPSGKYIVTKVGDKMEMVTVEEYSQMISSRLTETIKTLDTLRTYWIDPKMRKELIDKLPDDGRGLRLLRELTEKHDYDYYDILAEICFGIVPKRREERVFAFEYKNKEWLEKLPLGTKNTLIALVRQFKKGGIEELENPYIFEIPDILKAGGLKALKSLGEPQEIIMETKRRILAA